MASISSARFHRSCTNVAVRVPCGKRVRLHRWPHCRPRTCAGRSAPQKGYFLAPWGQYQCNMRQDQRRHQRIV
ncbi:hypothetical protein GQ600_21551 [Phytophthora cactorum]|nr:hypothetical protein GQ600_21551 [Phytophthora cactorum]